MNLETRRGIVAALCFGVVLTFAWCGSQPVEASRVTPRVDVTLYSGSGEALRHEEGVPVEAPCYLPGGVAFGTARGMPCGEGASRVWLGTVVVEPVRER
jgi:hypothetical protein